MDWQETREEGKRAGGHTVGVSSSSSLSALAHRGSTMASPRNGSAGEDPLSGLPEEVALHVLSFLGPREVCVISGLSHFWHKLALDSTLWRTLYLRSEHYRRALRRCQDEGRPTVQLAGGLMPTVGGAHHPSSFPRSPPSV